MTSAPRLLDPLRRDGPLLAAAPRLARTLLRDASRFVAAPHAMRIATAAGWPVPDEGGPGHASAERQAEAGGLA